jgi:hypothetical protein
MAATDLGVGLHQYEGLLQSEPSPVRPPRSHSAHLGAVVIAGYLLCGICAYWPVLPVISHQLFSVDGDFTLTVWFLGWVPHAILHGYNPFFSNAIFVPTGVNLAQNTEGPFLGLLAAPITFLFGPLVSANLLMVVAMPVSATAAFGVLRSWRVVLPAAAFGGLLYGFSPYMIGQGVGHPVALFMPLPPLIAWTVVRIVQRESTPRRLGVQLGLLLVAQYLVSQEVFATVVIFVGIALGCVALRHPMEAREHLHSLVVPGGIALATSSVFLAYPVWMLLAGPQHATGTTLPAMDRAGIHTDLFSLAVPGPLQRLALGTGGLGAHLIVGSNSTEAGGFVGLPLLLLAALLGWRSRRSPRMQLALVLAAIAVVLSFGPRLVVDGHRTALPLPFALLGHVPLLDNILAGRISYEVGAFLAAVVAFGLDDALGVVRHRHAHAKGGKVAGHGPAVLTGFAAVLIVVSMLPVWPYARQTIRVLPDPVKAAVPAGDPVSITYPYDTVFLTEPMLWQADAGFSFRLLGGYALRRGPRGRGTTLPALMTPAGLQEFLAAQEGIPKYGPQVPVSPALVASTRAVFRNYDVRVVIVDDTVPGAVAVVRLMDKVVGPPRLTSGGFSLWGVG